MPGTKMKMVMKDGKKVPAFAADGVGKMKKGGKPKGMKHGGKAKAKGMKHGGKAKKMAYGGKAKKPMGMSYGGKPVYKSRMQ